ncbi:Sec-independent protein translocase protein TatB [Desulfotignum phosphitoxidans]|jgi:Tat protein translocase TatB subunit|uniref:Twin arginine-targeting protein translocase TatB n=1 Tax=Desulfotignum phosphitoxidans DSM 13687 TaxID=1286635 RepID=S0G645_9BACT|nr:Sec-independent protein translocase protein TatB [Desulfotignum phosphitoxidans]EMS79841.1 twin arginine-targeting protein translocase TatB [Desulfotignum phosphitoxidans DSM 13687]
MFGLGMPEILLILAIALIVIGPQKLPELAKTLGRAMGEFKRSAQDLKRSIDMDTTLQDVKSSTTDLKDVIKDSKREKPSRKKPDTTDAAQGTDTDTSEVPDPATDADTSSSSKNTKDDTPADKKNSNG